MSYLLIQMSMVDSDIIDVGSSLTSLQHLVRGRV